uniref:tRNA-splicing endonuclease subunit SEN34 n=1 Tax=Timema cristinae TaxID=61476 RepID=A0A7R9CRV1_TIMCR|nr:unnamed protein product [Timema cristinae]
MQLPYLNNIIKHLFYIGVFCTKVECCIEERKRQITDMIDRIVEGKRRKLLGLNTKRRKKYSVLLPAVITICSDHNHSTECADALCLLLTTDKAKQRYMGYFDNGLSPSEARQLHQSKIIVGDVEPYITLANGSKNPPLANALVVLSSTAEDRRSEFRISEDACTVHWNFPVTPSEKLRYNTFKTLWEQGHFITPGQKFGGDFLAYPGDPVKFHAQFLIICVERTSALPMSEIVAFGRLGSSVRKTVVIASSSSDQKSVVFQSINWSGT